MLNLVLTPNDGGTAWRHLLASGEARAGWECVGPYGLARRLGRLLGMAADAASTPERIAAYTVRLDRDDDGTRSYSASRANDAFGVATYLLGLRDRLRLMGWSGAAITGSVRLTDLSRLESRPEPLPPGLPDVLERLTDELRHVGTVPVPVVVQLAAPWTCFSPRVRALLDALAAARADVTVLAPDGPCARPESDLGRLQRAVVDPAAPRAELRGDGSVQFLEADTALEAAELAADHLGREPLDNTTVLVATQPETLDAALARQGLPTLGLPVVSTLRPHLQVLLLRLSLAFTPQEPFRAAELLMLPGGPLPGHARRRLLDALAEMPGVWSPAWDAAVVDAGAEALREALADGLDDATAAAEAAKLEARIEQWFGGERADATSGLRAARAAEITSDVASWLRTRAGRCLESEEPAKRDQAPLWSHAAAVAQTLHRMLLSRPADELLGPVALMQLHATAIGAGAERAPWPAQAGRPAVALQSANVLSTARTVMWWGFVQDVETHDTLDAWSSEERVALTAAGVVLPAPGESRKVEAWSWRRTVLACRERVVFVRWRLAGAEVVQPHPFWDELEMRVAAGTLASSLVMSEAALGNTGKQPRARTVSIQPAAAIRPPLIWRIPGITVEGTQSASQLRTLLGCPFAWMLQHAAGLRPGRALEIADDNQLLGNFAHRLLEEVFTGPNALSLDSATEDEARATAERAFDARVATEAAPLVLRGREIELERGRRLVGGAAAALLRHLRAGGWSIVGAEQELEGSFQGHRLEGRADLVLHRRSDGVRAVLDLKLSGFKYRHGELSHGRGLQLALYASMLGRVDGKLPPAAYLLLDDGQLLTVTPQAFPGSLPVDGPSLEETLDAAGEALARWKKAFAAGQVPATTEDSGWEEEMSNVVGAIPDEDEPGRYPPPCMFCRFDSMCQVQLGAEVAR